MIHPKVLQGREIIRKIFADNRPFRHAVIENFFEEQIAEGLLRDFPPFDHDLAKNEFGRPNRKWTVADMRSIGPFYKKVYEYIQSPLFLKAISEMTGIPDLVADPKMFGGGTHENLEGQALYPHIDFNYLDHEKLHRRLNLLIYLNKEWEEDWGGAIELHSNPRRRQENTFTAILPLFNRCVIFETNERSWHAFRTIRLPEGKKHLSRRSISIYLYTKDRPLEEIVPPHSTFYWIWPLPGRLKSGYTLSEKDVSEIEHLIDARDNFLKHYQEKELKWSGEVEDLKKVLEHYKKVSAWVPVS